MQTKSAFEHGGANATMIRKNIQQNGKNIGSMTSGVWSRRLEKNIGLALINIDSKVGENAIVKTKNGNVKCDLVELPFL